MNIVQPKVATWVVGKRVFHWGLSIAVVIALIAPKPEDGEGLFHIMAGTTALALVMVRIGWRLLGDVRPRVQDSWRLKLPDLSKGLRGFAPLLIQAARIGGFTFLALIPVAVGLALLGIGQGEDSALLEAHEAAGTAIMVLAIGHALAVVAFTLISKFKLFAITIYGARGAFSEGGVRGFWGLALGAGLGLAALAYIWGPFDVASKASALAQQGIHGDKD